MHGALLEISSRTLLPPGIYSVPRPSPLWCLWRDFALNQHFFQSPYCVSFAFPHCDLGGPWSISCCPFRRCLPLRYLAPTQDIAPTQIDLPFSPSIVAQPKPRCWFSSHLCLLICSLSPPFLLGVGSLQVQTTLFCSPFCLQHHGQFLAHSCCSVNVW